MKTVTGSSLVLILSSISAIQATYDAPTKRELNSMIRTLQNDYFKTDSVTFNYVPTAVRLAFHDCVGSQDTCDGTNAESCEAKCDGCINLDNASNNGLAPYMDWLEAIYNDTTLGYSDIVSRADFWQVAAIAATEMAITQNNNAVDDGEIDSSYTMPTSIMSFRWGRSDCADSPGTSDVHEFPEPTMDRASMMTYFSHHYGFSEDEVVALMGAHTLGGCDAVDSGYRGMWVLNEAIYLNTKYYQFILGGESDATTPMDIINEPIDDFDRDEDGDWRYQWDLFEDGEWFDGSSNRSGIMLNTDMELAYDIDVDLVAGTTCVLSDAIERETGVVGTACTKATTYDLVKTYATDGDTWWTDYKAVFEKLTNYGYMTNGAFDLDEVTRE